MRVHPFLIALLASTLVGAFCVHEVLARAGEPALPLDDSFIHLQYARRLAEGHYFSYSPGDGYSAGATSFAWPLVLAPFFALGVEGLDIIWVVWAFGTLFHAGVAYDTGKLADGLLGRSGAIGCAAMCIVFGAFGWFAWSGMETVALAWMLVRTARRGSELSEARTLPDMKRVAELLALGLVGPLVRPEGGLCSVMACACIAYALWHHRHALAWPRWRIALLAVVPLVGPAIMPLSHRAFTGQTVSATAQVKWMALDPYVDSEALWTGIGNNVQLLLTDLLDGGVWTAVFVPEHFVVWLALGLPALLWLAQRRRRWWRAILVLAIVLATVVPCSYSTLLWNRVRYIWPFAPSWFVLASAFPVAVGALLRERKPLLEMATPVLLGAIVATLAAKLDWAVRDLAQSARAISLQQVALGRWASEELPADATIGVNDTGAIAYLSGRRTFDVVGLTKPGEARYWAAGAGSRYEHYERLGARELPSHFVVYPHWMRVPAVLGTWLNEATVADQSILGGRTMVVYRARYDALGSGALPAAFANADTMPPLLDELDIADLISESEHGYTLGRARASNNVAVVERGIDGVVADGGRRRRLEDRFYAVLPVASEMVMRVAGNVALEVWIDGRHMATAAPAGLANGTWEERTVQLPAGGAERSFVVVRPTEHRATFESYHYWWFERPTD